MWNVFDAISSNRNGVLSINLSANVFVFGDFNIHHKDWVTYSGGTNRPGELKVSARSVQNFDKRGGQKIKTSAWEAYYVLCQKGLCKIKYDLEGSISNVHFGMF